MLRWSSAILIVLSVCAGLAQADMATWQLSGDSSGSWETPANWSPAALPTSADMAWFSLGSSGVGTVNVTSDQTVGNVIVSPASQQQYTFAGPGVLNVTNGFYVAGGMVNVSATQTLNGDVIIPSGGPLLNAVGDYFLTGVTLSSAAGIAPGKSLYIGSTKGYNGAPIANGILILNGDIDPSSFIAPDSTGTVALFGDNVTATFTNLGNCFLGAYYGQTVYRGASLPAGSDGKYRIGGTGFVGDNSGFMEAFQIGYLWSNYANVLSGGHDLLVWNGGVRLNGPNNYTGTTTVSHNSNPLAWNMCALEGNIGASDPETGNYSPFGSPTGAVVLQQGAMQLENVWQQVDNDIYVNKGALTFEGQSALLLNKYPNWPSHPISGDPNPFLTKELDFTFASAARVNRGVLTIGSISSDLGIADPTSGKAARVFVTGDVETANGMTKPYYLNAIDAADANFLNYTTASGFVKIKDVDMTPLPASGGAGTEIALVTGMTTVTGDVNVWALKIANEAVVNGGGTVTIGSGGLIMIHNANSWLPQGGHFRFGPTVEGAFTPGEAVIYTPGNCGWTAAGTYFAGTVTADGMTKAGQGNLYMYVSNVGTLTGKIVIDSGILYADTNALGGGSGGAVVINGGAYAPTDTAYSAPWATKYNAYLLVDKDIAVGPMGGSLGDGRSQNILEVIDKPIVDDPEFGPSGPLTLETTTRLSAVNTFTGGLIVKGYTELYGTPGLGSVIVQGASASNGVSRSGTIVDYGTTGWTIPGRMSLMGAGKQLSLENEMTPPGMIWSFGSLEGTGDIVTGAIGNYILYPTFAIGSDGTPSDYFGRIYESSNYSTTAASIIKQGGGTLTMWGANTWHGTTTINGGTLRINGSLLNAGPYDSTPGGNGTDITVNDTGTLDGTGTIERNVIVNTGGTLAGGLTITGYVGLYGGTANMTGATVNGTVYVSMTGGASYAGTSTINGGAEVYTGSFSGAHTINGGVLVAGGAFSGANNITGNVTMNSGSFTGANVITGTVTSNGDFSGSATIGGAVQVDGGTFSGTHTINNNFTMYDGVVSGSDIISGDVVVNGGTFGGAHTIGGSVTVGTAIVAPGNSAGTTTVGGDMTLSAGTTLNFEFGAPGGPLGTSDLIDITGNLTLDGTLNVAALDGFGEGTYRLFNYHVGVNGLSGPGLAIGTTPVGFSYEISTATDGQVDLLVSTPWDLYDTNHDTFKNSKDIDEIYLNIGTTNSLCDVDQDGDVDKDDVTAELHLGFLTNYADANLNTKVDLEDFQALLDHWQTPGGWNEGDFTGDGEVEFEDFQMLLDYWNPSGIWGFSQAPEPTTMVLLALGGLALLRRNRRA